MTSTKICKIGDSQGIVLPKEVLAHFNAEEGDVLYVTKCSDGSMRITPYDPEFEEQMNAAKEAMKAYHSTLRELAE